MKFKGIVTVVLKEGIFDPQGEAVKGSLVSMGFEQVSRVRIGKNIAVELDTQTQEEASDMLDEMARKLLANPVIETYEIQVVPG
ncbi:MAG: phosphoribosylformylglycinamidine synthase subunit PurS [Bacillota bacterium]|jgi:phosphoribosylformylglycinamidine synthase PurS subunit